MDIEKIMFFFYKKASLRIKAEVEKSKLTQRKIYITDPKQISWIINNHRTKNNRFLITDSVLQSYICKDKSIGLLPKLSFSSKSEILWGTKEEITSYLPDLFRLLWNEVSEENNFYHINKEEYLCDYIPYAKYSTYWNILLSPQNYFPAIAYGIYENTVFENIDSAREYAFKFLYDKCKNDFAKIFIDFTDQTASFHKIDMVFRQSFIEKLFIPMLNRFKPDDNSLGMRVKMLIEKDLSLCAPLVCIKGLESEYYSKLINASSEYILALEKIQEEDCGFAFIEKRVE